MFFPKLVLPVVGHRWRNIAYKLWELLWVLHWCHIWINVGIFCTYVLVRLIQLVRYVGNLNDILIYSSNYIGRFLCNEDRQCKCRVKLRCFCATIVAVEKNIKYYVFRVCVCSLRYPSCNACAPYCRLWPRLCSIFPHYLMNSTVCNSK